MSYSCEHASYLQSLDYRFKGLPGTNTLAYLVHFGPIISYGENHLRPCTRRALLAIVRFRFKDLPRANTVAYIAPFWPNHKLRRKNVLQL